MYFIVTSICVLISVLFCLLYMHIFSRQDKAESAAMAVAEAKVASLSLNSLSLTFLSLSLSRLWFVCCCPTALALEAGKCNKFRGKAL